MAKISPANSVDKPERPREFRRRFVMIDPRKVDKELLYFDSSGTPQIGLILETERQSDGRFLVRQAAPGRMTKAGVRGKVIGAWKVVHSRWDSKNGKGR